MLSARRSLRRATSSLLRRPGPRIAASQRPHLVSLPLPQNAAFRGFSQQNDNSQTFLGRVKNSLTDARAAVKLVVQEAIDLDLTSDEASTLLASYAKQKKIDDIIGLLRYCQEEHLDTETAARSSAFRTLCDAGAFQPALQLFDSLMRDGVELKPWMVGRALDAAHKLKRPEMASTICRQFVSKTFSDGKDANGVRGMLQKVMGGGETLNESALRSIAIFADRAGEAELALEVLDRMKESEVNVGVDVYASVMEACGKAERWGELVQVYEDMPETLRSKLYSKSLSLVVRAHTRSESEKLVVRGLDIFARHDRGKWSIYPCDAALEALLQTRQLDRLFALADEMKQHGLKWSSFTYRMMTLAYIESGSAEKAKQMLLFDTSRMEDGGVECYRELVVHHAKANGDRLEACQLYADLMQNNVQLDVPDWIKALELALALPDRKMYSRFRMQLRLQSKSTQAMIPPRLLVPVPEELDEHHFSAPLDVPERIELVTPNIAADASPPQNIYDKWKTGNEVGLTEEEASSLLADLARDRRVDECMGLLSYCQDQDLSLDSTSLSSAFRALCDADKLEPALQAFEALCKRKIVLAPWMYGRVLDAATKLKRGELVAYVFRRLLLDGNKFENFQVEASADGVYGMVRDAGDRGIKLSKLGLRSLAIFADRADHPELALDILSIMESEGLDVTLDVYGAALHALGQSKRWGDVTKVYESMPKLRRSQLTGGSLSWVITAKRVTKHQEPATRTLCRKDGVVVAQTTRALTQKPTGASDVSLAQESFDDIRSSGGKGLTKNAASTLLMTMANHKRVYDCLEMLRYFEKQGVTPKPFAIIAVFAVCCDVKEYDHALQVFETLYQSDCVLEPWTFGWAMNAATNLDQHKYVSMTFRRLLSVGGGPRKGKVDLRNLQLEAIEGDVYDMLQDACDRGVKVPEFALQALASFADMAHQSDLALEVLSIMQDEGMNVSCEMYEPVLNACGKSECWNHVLDVFESMPERFHSQLSSSALGSVVMAHTRSGDRELAVLGLEFFKSHPSKWSSFACNATLQALLETSQLDEVLTLADEMKRQRVKWSSFTHKLVILAHIRNDSIDKAMRLLRTSTKSKITQNDSAACYRELIDYYAETRADHLEALQLSVEMMDNSWQLQFSDWCTALELALELPDHTVYWKVRKHLWLRGEPFDQKIPSHLLLPERANPQTKVMSFLREENAKILLDVPPMPADISLAQEVFDDIWNAGGSGLTENIASTLLSTMAKYRHIDECLEMMEYFQDQKVTVKPFARIATFRAFCDAKEDDGVLHLLEAMLHDDLVLRAQDYPVALSTTMKLRRHDLVTRVLNQMRLNDKSISSEDFEHITSNFGREQEWDLTLDRLSTLVSDSIRDSSR